MNMVKALPNCERQNSRLAQIECMCRWQIRGGQVLISGVHRVENIVGKGEYVGHQEVLLFPRCFQNVFCI